MAVSGKSKKELIEEINALRSRLKELEHNKAECRKAGQTLREAEEALRESEERYHGLSEAAFESIFISEKGVCLEQNSTAEKTFGYTLSETIGRKGTEWIAPEDREMVMNNMLSGYEGLYEATALRKDGTIFPAEIQARMMHYKGRTVRVTALRDITERRKAEKALRESEQKLQAIFNQTFQFIGLMKTDGILIEANRTALKFAGIEESDVLNKPFWETPWWTHSSELQDQLREAVSKAAAGQFIRFEATHPAADGSIHYIDFSLKPVKDEKGNVVWLIPEGRDITERKRMEELLRKAHDELEVKVQERTAELRQANEILKTEITNRKKAEKALRESEAKYRMLFENTSMPVTFWSLNDWRLLSINAEAAGKIGRAPEEVIGKTMDEVFSVPDVAEKARKIFEEVLDSGKGYQAEDCIEVLDGVKCWFRSDIQPVRDENGRIIAIQALSEDITEQKRLEEAYHNLVDYSIQGLEIIQDGKILFLNRAFTSITGYSEDELLAMSPEQLLALVHPEDREMVWARHQDRLAGKPVPPRYEFRCIRKDGSTRWVEVHANRIEYRGRPAIQAAYIDITRRKQMEDALRISEEKYYTLFQQSAQSMLLCDLETLEIVEFNDSAHNSLGYTREEFEKLKIPDYEVIESPEEIEAHVQKLIKNGFDIFETKNRTKSGEIRNVLVNVKVIKLHDKLYSMAILTDFTERKQAQGKLLDYQEKLKSLASQLSVIEERERHRLATELHDQIGQSLVMSKMKLDSLRESISSGESADVLEEVCNCLGDVIRDTRTLTFDLSSPILYELGFETAVTEWLDENIREKSGIQTEFRDDGQPKPLDNDIRAILFRNVRELLINIVKHAKAQKVKVSVSKVDEQICVIIEDDGVGFKPAKIGSNTGFGIFSIRERLEQLDGHLEIESEPDRGSRFTMTAPLKVEKSTEGVEI